MRATFDIMKLWKLKAEDVQETAFEYGHFLQKILSKQ